MTTSVFKIKSYIKTIFNLLYLSITSIEFYKDVRLKFKGWGASYILVICIIISIMNTIILLERIREFKNTLVSKQNLDLEMILDQIPELKYDGMNITSDIQSPYFIKDSTNHYIAAIDLDGSLSFNERSTIPLVFTDKNLILYSSKKNDNIISLPYQYLLNKDPWIITKDSLREYIIKNINEERSIYLYIMPIYLIMIFMGSVFGIIFPVIVLYLVMNCSKSKITFKTAMRLGLFSYGPYILGNFLLNLFTPEIAGLSQILPLITTYLVVRSLYSK